MLEVFSQVSGIELDFAELREEAQALDERLRKVIARAKRLSQAASPLLLPGPSFLDGLDDDGPDPAVVAEIEALFARAQTDRSVALELKEKLDEHELFGNYENRFLDLFTSR